MSNRKLNEREFRRFQKMLEREPELKEIVEWAINPERPQLPRRHLLIPYISAPRLTETTWK
jgi:hypothetical protein